MSLQRVNPPGNTAELGVPAPAPIDFDGGFFMKEVSLALLSGKEPELLISGPLIPGEDVAANMIDTSVDPPPGAAEEVVRSHRDGLPAAEYRLQDPKHYKIEPRLNDKGLIDDKALIADVMATISPDFSWRGPVDRHHLCWPRADYVTAQQASPTKAYTFREHGSNVIRVQRVFHNWIHAITLPPPMPDPEVMQYTLRAWEVVSDFFGAVRQTVNHQRLFVREEQRRGGYTAEQQDMVREMLVRELSGVVMHLEALQDIPEDYWPFQPDIKLQVAAGKVGQVLTKGYLNRTREVRLANVA